MMEIMVRSKRVIQINKSGNQMVEAALALPLVILSIMLLIRLFTFYLQILSTGILEHEKAIEAGKSFNGLQKVYESVENVQFLEGGLLENTLNKDIKTKAYFYNEDMMVRAKNGIKNE